MPPPSPPPLLARSHIHTLNDIWVIMEDTLLSLGVVSPAYMAFFHSFFFSGTFCFLSARFVTADCFFWWYELI